MFVACFVLIFAFASCSKEALRLAVVYNDLTINSAADLPDLKKNTRLTGSLTLEFAPDEEVDLSVLENIIEIERNLVIKGGVNDAHLQHLRNITSVASLEILDNQQLSSLAPLAELQVTRDFTIVGSNVSDIAVFSNIEALEGDLEIMSCPNIQDLSDHFPFLETVNGNVTIVFNAGLEAVGLKALRMADEISFTDQPALASLALPALEEAKTLSIIGSGELENLDQLSKVQKINRLVVLNNPLLVDLNAGTQLEYVGTAWIRENVLLDDFCMLQQASIVGTIHDYDVQGNQYNPSLGDLATACIQ